MSETMNEDVIVDSFEEEYLQKILEDFGRRKKLSNMKSRINMGSGKGDNFIGVVYRVTIEGDKDGKTEKISIIFKCPPMDEIQRQLRQSQVFFTTEIWFYEKVVAAYSELLRELNKPDIDFIPICYGASCEDHKEVLILEDLKVKGFVMRDRLKQLDYPHASLALKHLGRLHALSFALRDQKPDVFKKLTEWKEPLFRSSSVGNEVFERRVELLRKPVEIALSREDPHYLERFNNFMDSFFVKMEWCCNGAKAEPYAVVNHGDFWSNNMMFRYEKGSTDPKDFYFLDFQVARYASPALDIVYMIFCSCSQELRSNHYDQLIREYHDSLTEHLIELGSDPKLFPYDTLIDHLQKYGKFAAGMALFTTNLFTSSKEDIEEFQEDDSQILSLPERVQRDHHYRNTLRDSYKDLVDRNYI